MAAARLPLRSVGSKGPQATAIGFGLMGLSVGYGNAHDDEDRLKVLDRAWEIGCTNWDTADCYADSEDLIGKWFKLHPERRADIFLATKFGIVGSSVETMCVDSSAEHCREAVESSLKRLGVDYIDLYYLHRPHPDYPIEKTMEAMKQIKEEGKIKHLGISELASSTLRRAHAITPISAIQVEYSPWDIDIEGTSGTNLMATCRELGIAIFAYSPLGRGMLTGRYRSPADFGENDVRKVYDRFQPENFPKNLVLVDKIAAIAKRKGCTSSQLCLAWLLAQGDDIFVIPGTKSIKYLEENVGASNVSMTAEEVQELRKVVADAEIRGTRMPNFGSYVDTVALEDAPSQVRPVFVTSD